MTRPDPERARILKDTTAKVRQIQDMLDYALSITTLNERPDGKILADMTSDLQHLIAQWERFPTPQTQPDNPTQPHKPINSSKVDLDSLNPPHSTPDTQDKPT